MKDALEFAFDINFPLCNNANVLEYVFVLMVSKEILVTMLTSYLLHPKQDMYLEHLWINIVFKETLVSISRSYLS